MHKKFRFAGWLLVGGLLAASLIAPAGASAADTKPDETASAPVETESAPAETASAPVETESAPAETASLPAETASIVVNPNCPDCPSSGPSGRVDAETGTPNEDVTPPATDAIAPHNTPSNDGWQLVLVALAALLATTLILTPASRKTRR